MLLSTTTEGLNEKLGDAGAIKLLAEVGFDAFDMSFMAMSTDASHPLNGENYLEYVKGLKELADGLGIACNQAHAPYPSSYGDERDEYKFEQIVRSMECAAILGAKVIVVHPKQHLKYIENAETLRQMNIEYYKSLVPYCEKYGIKVACENMWQFDNGRVVDSACASPEDFCYYVDAVGSEWVVACLDLGHVPIVGRNIPDMIKALGPRLFALHVHDNDTVNDTHLLPFTSNIDYNEVARALKGNNYQGDLTFEADAYFIKMPVELLRSAAELMRDVGRYIISKI